MRNVIANINELRVVGTLRVRAPLCVKRCPIRVDGEQTSANQSGVFNVIDGKTTGYFMASN